MNVNMDAVTMPIRDERTARKKMIGIIEAAGRYVAGHAGDFVARDDSDEATAADGLDITIHVSYVDSIPTISVRREMFVTVDAEDAGPMVVPMPLTL